MSIRTDRQRIQARTASGALITPLRSGADLVRKRVVGPDRQVHTLDGTLRRCIKLDNAANTPAPRDAGRRERARS